MTAYCDSADLEAFLGRALTDAEAAQADDVIDAATDLIDGYTGRSWRATAITAELHTVLGRTLRLDHPPVSAISLLRTRPQAIGAAWATLASGTGYELIDASAGLLLLSGTYDVITTTASSCYGQMIEATYTSGAAVPAPVKLAAEMLAAGLLAGGLASGTSAASGVVKRFTVDGETVEFDTSSTTSGGTGTSTGLPSDVASLLAPYKRAVMFA